MDLLSLPSSSSKWIKDKIKEITAAASKINKVTSCSASQTSFRKDLADLGGITLAPNTAFLFSASSSVPGKPVIQKVKIGIPVRNIASAESRRINCTFIGRCPELFAQLKDAAVLFVNQLFSFLSPGPHNIRQLLRGHGKVRILSRHNSEWGGQSGTKQEGSTAARWIRFLRPARFQSQFLL